MPNLIHDRLYAGNAHDPRSLSILYISYPLLAISDESAGGAEQMLLTLEREMASRDIERPSPPTMARV